MTVSRSGAIPWRSFEERGIDAHLEDGSGLDRAGELRVGDVVAPVAQRRTRPVIPLEQEVRVPAPASVEERGLEDDVGAALHRLERRRLGGSQLGRRPEILLGDLDDAQPSFAQCGQVGRLVQVALLLDQLDRRVIAPERLGPVPEHTPEFQGGQVIAGEEADEVRGADDDRPVVGVLHRRTVPVGSDSLAVSRRRRGAGRPAGASRRSGRGRHRP